MTNPFDAVFSSERAARAYDSVLVPRLFTPCAITLLVRLGLAPGEAMVDIACGTGAVPRLAAPILGPRGRVHGRDLTEGMVDVARAIPVHPCAAPIDWGIAPAERLDLDDASVDVATCQQGLQFFPDPAAAVREMHRVLRPNGRVGIAVWKGIAECPLWAACQDAVRIQLGDEQADLLETPFSWPGVDALDDVLAAAGFTEVVISTHTIVMHFEGGMAEAAPSFTATPVGRELAALGAEGYSQFLDNATRALGRSKEPTDPVDVPAVTLVATARR